MSSNTNAVFNCPKCNGSLEPDGSAKTIRCPFCGASVIVPESIRNRTAEMQAAQRQQTPFQEMPYQPPVVMIGDPYGASRSMGRGIRLLIWSIVGITLCVTVVSIVVPLVATAGVLAWVGSIFGSEDMFGMPASAITETGGTTTTTGGGFEIPDIPLGGAVSSGFAERVMEFGTEGIGQGQFTDARAIAVDGAGNIYVGEYLNGRIQVFDAQGAFKALWMVDPEMPLRGLAASNDGTVYVVQSGRIQRYEGATGTLLGEVAYNGGTGFDDIVVAPDGSLVAAWYINRDDIVRFNSSGTQSLVISEAISGVSGDSELDTRVAVDGLGNIYALGTFNTAVFVYNAEGRFQNRFGSDGDEPGQFRAPSAIAVDGQGRVYVADIWGIDVFASDGRYLDTIEIDSANGVASGMAIRGNELFVAARARVIKFLLPPAE